MVKLLLVLIIVLSTNADEIHRALSSKRVFSNLLSANLATFHQSYPRSQLRMRAKLFLKNLKEVADCNDVQHYSCGTNQFSTMTDEERQQHLGLANTTHPNKAVRVPRYPGAPESKDWRESGAVTDVKNQGDCGSCWAFSAAGSIEGQYAVTTGKLRDFSEQELLECTYEKTYPGYDGCAGGWYFDSFDYVMESDHLALEKDNPYAATDGICYGAPNGMVDAKVTGYVEVDESDDALADAIALTPVSVAFLATGTFFSYTNGVYDGAADCTKRCDVPNHALVAVAYTWDTFVIKNSWGSKWGDRGYVTVKRGSDVCRVSSFVYYPTMKKSGDDTEPTVTVTPSSSPAPDNQCKDPEEESDCRDLNTRDCPSLQLEQCVRNDRWTRYTSVNCRKSCRFCNNIPLQDLDRNGCKERIAESSYGCDDELVALVCPKSCCKKGDGGDDNNDGGDDDNDRGDDDNDGCPKGTTRCGDGTCKHVHMC